MIDILKLKSEIRIFIKANHITKPNIRSENMFDIIKEETDYDKYSKYHTGNEKKKSKP